MVIRYPFTRRKNPRKHGFHQAGVDTLSEGVGEHVWVLLMLEAGELLTQVGFKKEN